MAHVLTEKLIRRHPHVFGDTTADTSAAVLTQWDAIKRTEKGVTHEPYLNGVGKGLPALMKAQKVQKKAARVGFDWADAKPVFAKIREETAEIEQAVESGDPEAIADEIGDLLFSVVNLARKLGVESEAALASANNKFVRRFHSLEEKIVEDGKSLGALTLAEMDAVWDQVKVEETKD
jgi:MazG family protein